MRRFTRFPRHPAGKLFVVLALAAMLTPSSAVNAGDDDYVAMLGYLTRSHEARTRPDTGERFADDLASALAEQDDVALLEGGLADWATVSTRFRGDSDVALDAARPAAHVPTYVHSAKGKALALSVSELPR